MTEPVSPQPVLTPLTTAAVFLVLGVAAGGEDKVRTLLGEFSAIATDVAALAVDSELACVVGFGSEAFDRLFEAELNGARPAHLHVLPEIVGARHTSVSTPGDLLLHVRARSMGLCFEFVERAMWQLDGVVTVIDEVHGFGYFDERNLMGFVDGTANPIGAEAVEAVLISSSEDPAFADGSYVVVQKYLHDLSAWQTLSVAEQERVIGRSKVDDIEMDDAVKPLNSHVAATTLLDDDGAERQIVRRNMPFGRPGYGEYGTYFIGYAADPAVTEQMLVNMFLGRPEGNPDRILDFSTAITGTLFFVPSRNFLDGLKAAAPGGVSPQRDYSLGIGGLKYLNDSTRKATP
ncbi:MAG TPA: Dyp-type peroxidase [Jatrophihabitans sp.]